MRDNYFNLINNFDTLSNFEIIVVGGERCSPSHSEGPTVRTDYLFHYIISGKGKVIINGNEYNLTSGNGFLITYKDYIYYEADKDDPWHYVWFIIKGNGSEKFFSSCGLDDERPIYFSNNVDKTNKSSEEFTRVCHFVI